MTEVLLVDANVILDVFNADPSWESWSSAQLLAGASDGLAINPIIYAEISFNFDSDADLRPALGDRFQFLDLPWEAALPAGRAFLAYRRGGGQRSSPLPDFYIGAHAQVAGLTLLTRDSARYRSYFPQVQLVSHT